MPDCENCSYYRKAKAPDPLAGWHVLSTKVNELRSKWEKHLAERAMFEQQRFESALPFNFKPLAYPYCDYFTRESGLDPMGEPARYWLCADKNSNGDCSAFEEKKEQ